MVGDLDKRNTAVHPVVLTVEDHFPVNLAWAVPLPETVSVSFSGFDTPRIVKSPSTSKVLGPICTNFVDLNVINGFRSTSKKSSLFSFPFFMPLPVFTLSA